MNAPDSQQSSLLQLVSQITLAWVALYTRGVPTDFRDRRRAELESDVWEHAFNRDREGAHDTVWKRALQMIGRLLVGMPADLAWRMELISLSRLNHSSTASRRPVMYRSRIDKLLLGVIVLLGFFAIFNSVGMAFNDEMGENAVLWSTAMGIPSLCILAGFFTMYRARPQRGMILVIVGALGNLFMYIWLLPIMLVISGFIIWFGVTRARRAIDSNRVMPANAA